MIPEYLSLQIPDGPHPRVVIVGGGFAGIEFAKALKNKPFQVVLLDRNNYHTFQPLLYQVATAGLEPDSIAGPLRKAFDGYKNFFFRMVKVQRVDYQNQLVKTPIGSLRYDYLVLASGSATNFFGLDQVKRYAFPLKQVVHALNLRSHILQNFEKAVLTDNDEARTALMNVVVVGGGPTGVEVAGALGELQKHILPGDFPDLDFSDMQVYLIEGTDRLLNTMSPKSGQKSKQYLEKFGIQILLNQLVVDYDGDSVYLDNGEVLDCQTLIWAAGVQGNVVEGIPAESLKHNRIQVDAYHQVIDMPRVFALGDVALMNADEGYPQGHPMVAQVAIQQGRSLAKNFVCLLRNKPPKPFKYRDKGSMATVGRNRAVVDFPQGGQMSGLWAWLVWMFIHLISLIGFRNKLVTLTNWMWSYFTYDKGNRLIIRTFDKKKRSPVEVN
ncbi:MAG: NAD(P)/FAD-dependent oxidoreductase [Cyclobacteriaceae bacterium]|nr:NAD(P)/FAD-dependent oxidoreductase [Cyclobacteriaceae bacterium]